MFREFVKHNKKRRIGSMLKNVFNKAKYFLVLALFVITPIKAWGGLPFPFIPVVDTDFPSFQLYFPWDLRNRETFIQVTNVSGEDVVIHVQVFNDGRDCLENSFWDELTPNDTNVYNLREIQGDPDGNGFVVVTTVDGVGSTDANEDGLLFGNFRIIDKAGYEYRSNAAGLSIDVLEFGPITDLYSFNFNNVDGTNQSDVIGIAVSGAGTGAVSAGGAVAAIFGGDPEFPILIFNDEEVPADCDVAVFVCGEPNQFLIDTIELEIGNVPLDSINFEFGISSAYPNSQGAPANLCVAAPTTGWVSLPLTAIVGEEEPLFFVGFIGLNNGDGTGSMDTWWASPFFFD